MGSGPAQPPSHILLRKQAAPWAASKGDAVEYWQSEAPISTCPRLALESRSHNFQIFMGVGENPVGP